MIHDKLCHNHVVGVSKGIAELVKSTEFIAEKRREPISLVTVKSIAKDVLKITRVTLEVGKVWIPMRILRGDGCIAHRRIGVVAGRLVRPFELIVKCWAKHIMLHCGVHRSLIEAPELDVCCHSSRDVEKVESNVAGIRKGKQPGAHYLLREVIGKVVQRLNRLGRVLCCGGISDDSTSVIGHGAPHSRNMCRGSFTSNHQLGSGDIGAVDDHVSSRVWVVDECRWIDLVEARDNCVWIGAVAACRSEDRIRRDCRFLRWCIVIGVSFRITKTTGIAS